MRATRTILTDALLEGRPIPVHCLAAKSGFAFFLSLGIQFLQCLAQFRTEKCMDVGSAYEVLELLMILVQLEFLFFCHLDQSIRGISETFRVTIAQV